eukprot:scaffold434_cov186-Pinguiococcus_pyrenoidosus.AAC.132
MALPCARHDHTKLGLRSILLPMNQLEQVERLVRMNVPTAIPHDHVLVVAQSGQRDCLHRAGRGDAPHLCPVSAAHDASVLQDPLQGSVGDGLRLFLGPRLRVDSDYPVAACVVSHLQTQVDGALLLQPPRDGLWQSMPLDELEDLRLRAAQALPLRRQSGAACGCTPVAGVKSVRFVHAAAFLHGRPCTILPLQSTPLTHSITQARGTKGLSAIDLRSAGHSLGS